MKKIYLLNAFCLLLCACQDDSSLHSDKIQLLPTDMNVTGATAGSMTGATAGAMTGASVNSLGSDFCGVLNEVLIPKCAVCHQTGATYPDLSAAHAKEILSLSSQAHPDRALVVPGNPMGSLLYRKMAGIQSVDEGGLMPPGRMPLVQELSIVEAWINAGASATCDGEINQNSKHHPEGFSDPLVHGLELKQGLQNCRNCHGNTLEGGVGPSCDRCHQPNWRSNCSYCHGDPSTGESAPPRDLKNSTALDQMTFRPHAQHLVNPLHGNWDCDQCHVKPTDVLSEKHVFDDTPGKAEVDFSQGLSASGTYDGNGGCANLYCHGSGKVNGSYQQDAIPPNCTGCHSSANLQGRHRKHLREGVACGECHSSVATGSNTVIDGNLHVNGEIDVLFQSTSMNRSNQRCTGSCHGEYHGGESW